MMKIEVIADTTARFEVYSGWNNGYISFVPVYFEYRGGRRFIHNRRVYESPEGTPDARADERSYVDQLERNDGRFFCFHNGYRDRCDLEGFKAFVKRRRLTLTKDYRVTRDGRGHVDVCGNFREVSCAFSYRFYDEELARDFVSFFDRRNEAGRKASLS